MSDSPWPHEPQHARPPCPSPTPGVHPNSCASSWWCHPAISSSVIPFSFCPQSFPASGSFPMSQLFAWGGQSIKVSSSTSVPPMNTQDWSPLEWTGWVSLKSKGLSRVFSNTTVQKHQFFGAQLSSQSNSHIHTWLLEKPVYADANYPRLPFENRWNTYSLNLSFTHNWEFFSCIISRIVSVPKSSKDWKPLFSWMLPKNLGYLLIRSTRCFWYQFLQTYLSHITVCNEFCLFSVPQHHRCSLHIC